MSYVNLPNILLSVPRNPVFAVGLPLTIGLLSAAPTPRAVQGLWYNSLYVPPGKPPSPVYRLLWPVWYISMGWASHLAIRAFDSAHTPSTSDDAYNGLALYYGQLALNALWSPLFFRAKETGWALLDSTLLTGTAFYMTKKLHNATDGATTWLLGPYCAWLTYATYLNGGIWYLNRGRTLNKRD